MRGRRSTCQPLTRQVLPHRPVREPPERHAEQGVEDDEGGRAQQRQSQVAEFHLGLDGRERNVDQRAVQEVEHVNERQHGERVPRRAGDFLLRLGRAAPPRRASPQGPMLFACSPPLRQADRLFQSAVAPLYDEGRPPDAPESAAEHIFAGNGCRVAAHRLSRKTQCGNARREKLREM